VRSPPFFFARVLPVRRELTYSEGGSTAAHPTTKGGIEMAKKTAKKATKKAAKKR
jgi:hypothetical protein